MSEPTLLEYQLLLKQRQASAQVSVQAMTERDNARAALADMTSQRDAAYARGYAAALEQAASVCDARAKERRRYPGDLVESDFDARAIRALAAQIDAGSKV